MSDSRNACPRSVALHPAEGQDPFVLCGFLFLEFRDQVHRASSDTNKTLVLAGTIISTAEVIGLPTAHITHTADLADIPRVILQPSRHSV